MPDARPEAESGIPRFLSNGGEAARLIASRDWSASLGPIDTWPDSLKFTIGLVVRSPVAMVLLWGRDGIMLYNDAYAVVAGKRHPAMMGQKVLQAWPEAAAFNEHVMTVGLAGGALAFRDQELVLERSGAPERVWMDLDYAPVFDESGRPGGVIAFVVETTERVVSEKAVVAERDRLAQMFQQAPTLIAMLSGPEHRVDLANPAFLDLAGNRQLIGRPVAEAMPEVVTQGYLDLLDRVFRTGEAHRASGSRFEARSSPDAPGDLRYVDFVYQPLTDANGAVTGIFVEGVDVTREHVAQIQRDTLAVIGERLRDEEDPRAIASVAAEALAKALGTSRAGYGSVDADTETAHITGEWDAPGIVPLPAEVPLRHYGSFIDGLKADEMVVIGNVANDARTAGSLAAMDERQVRALVNVPVVEQGRLVAILFVNSAVPRAWSAGELNLIREVAQRTRTAVERARAQAALRQSEARLRFLDELGRAVTTASDADEILRITTRMVGEHLDVSICAYADMDPDQDGFTIRGDWSAPGSPSIVGHYSLADFGRLAVRNLGAGEPLIVNDNSAELAPEEAATFQAIGIRATICMPLVKEGRLTALMAIHDKAPRQWTARELSVIREVTERSWAHIERVGAFAELRQSAAALSDLNATLEQRVEERTAELTQAEAALRQAQKMEAIGQLTGGIAHDFNNLLAGISGSLELLEKRLADGRMTGLDRYINAAQGASRRAAALTQRLLAFSRRQTLDPKAVDVNRLIGGMEDLIGRSVGPDVAVEVVGSAGLWPTLVDPSQLENSLLNLCINARDAMAPAGGRIIIETSNRLLDGEAAKAIDIQAGHYVCLSVTDTGVGMSPEVIARAFDPFFTTKPLGEGTGLGLSMVYGFARQSGGQVHIESEPGRGTTMSLYLPRHLGEVDGGETSDPRLMDGGDGEVVLVVDDEPTIRLLIVEVLEENGYSALEAADGPGALRILQSDTRIDLLITDVGLPNGMNGRQVADAARVSRPDLKVLFITGFAETAVIGDGRLEPGMAVITKPFVMAALGSKIRDLIGS